MPGSTPGVLTLRESLEATMRAGLVSVDDGGAFTFHESADAALRDYEYPAEAACILDRQGPAFRLALDGRRRLVMKPAGAAPELSWLHQAWSTAQRREPHRYPLRRFYARDREALLESIFECLVLERRGPVALRGLLAPAPASHGHGMVQDPFGHVYRPARLPALVRVGHGLEGKSTIFVEVSAKTAAHLAGAA